MVYGGLLRGCFAALSYLSLVVVFCEFTRRYTIVIKIPLSLLSYGSSLFGSPPTLPAVKHNLSIEDIHTYLLI